MSGLWSPSRPPAASDEIRWPLDLGLPDVATFPRSAFMQHLDRTLAGATPPLLYGGPGRKGIAMGHAGLRAALAERAGVCPDGRSPSDAVMLTSGAAHAVELLWRAFLDRGDAFAIEAPTWGAAIRIGRSLGAEPLAIPMDRDGMCIEVLERELARLRSAGRRLKIVYTIATYNTPTGWSLSLPRRQRLLQLAEEHDFLVVEDRVYADLRYDGPLIPAMATLAGGDRVVSVGSFSKTLAPALRAGWLVAEPHLVDVVAGHREDLGSSQLTGDVLESFLRSGDYDTHLSGVVALYRRKRDAVVTALRAHCGDAVRFDVPDGGMFFWIELAPGVDGSTVMAHAREGGVACRPGEAFFGDDGGHEQWFRMAFTMVPEDELVRGVQVLGDAIGRSRSTSTSEPFRRRGRSEMG
jgi:2-aminoadipate transaminase